MSLYKYDSYLSFIKGPYPPYISEMNKKEKTASKNISIRLNNTCGTKIQPSNFANDDHINRTLFRTG